MTPAKEYIYIYICCCVKVHDNKYTVTVCDEEKDKLVIVIASSPETNTEAGLSDLLGKIGSTKTKQKKTSIS